MNAIVPVPRYAIAIRTAALSDLPFIDSLQRIHSKQVGWMPRMQLEEKIRRGNVVIAEERHEGTEAQRHEGKEGEDGGSASSLPSVPACLRASVPSPVGYSIGSDQYFKRDDVGIIYQMNILPGKQRSLVGATLLKAMFDRAAYGCKLFCCWCAQDIAANHFWESVGFIPLAFRTGSRGRGTAHGAKGGNAAGSARVHIFWQRRIRAGDETTPYWFPSQTTSGSIREDRLVLPIPPGTHWSDAKPIILPGSKDEGGRMKDEKKRKKLPGPSSSSFIPHPSSLISAGGLRFAAMQETAIELREAQEDSPRRKEKNDPRLVAAARELRDRWLEQVNAAPLLSHGKYDLSRQLPTREAVEELPQKLLIAA